MCIHIQFNTLGSTAKGVYQIAPLAQDPLQYRKRAKPCGSRYSLVITFEDDSFKNQHQYIVGETTSDSQYIYIYIYHISTPQTSTCCSHIRSTRMIDAILVTGLPASGRSTLLLQLLKDPDLADARCAAGRPGAGGKKWRFGREKLGI